MKTENEKLNDAMGLAAKYGESQKEDSGLERAMIILAAEVERLREELALWDKVTKMEGHVCTGMVPLLRRAEKAESALAEQVKRNGELIQAWYAVRNYVLCTIDTACEHGFKEVMGAVEAMDGYVPPQLGEIKERK